MEQFPAREEEEVTETEISRDRQPVVPSSGSEDPLRYEDPVMQSGVSHRHLQPSDGDGRNHWNRCIGFGAAAYPGH